MLKPLQSKYNDNRKGQKWVKLKKDFIPGAGDTLDFYILGATWSKKRGRDLGGKSRKISFLARPVLIFILFSF